MPCRTSRMSRWSFVRTIRAKLPVWLKIRSPIRWRRRCCRFPARRHARGSLAAPFGSGKLGDRTFLVGKEGVDRTDMRGQLVLQQDRRALPLIIAEIGTMLRIRSEEHTSELQSLMRISYAVFCLKKKKKILNIQVAAY